MATAPGTQLDPTRPFTYAEGIASGLSPGLLRGPRYRRIFHGIYISAAAPRHPLERIVAALMLHPPRAYASHTSAARVYDLPVPSRLSEEHVTVFHRADRRSRRGLKTHLAPPSGLVCLRQGIRVPVPTQLFCEMASMLNLVELVVLGDAMVRRKLTTPEDLVAAAAAMTGKHSALARRAAGYVRRDVDSPMESRLRMLIVLAGLPEPRVNFKIRDEHGRVKLRFDLCYPELRLIVEYDGRQHRDDDDQWDRDNDRDDYFDDNAWRIVRVFHRGIYKEPEKTIRRVRNALVARGCTDLPRRLSEEWREYFPG